MLSKLIETLYIFFLYKMTLAHYVLSSLLLLCQLSLHPAQESKESLEYPASFNCGNFSEIRFPFSNTENPKCGLFVMNCSGSKPTFQFHESGKWHQVDYMNELDQTIVISDQDVRHHLESNHCDLLGNFTEEDTRFLSINVTRIPLFKCKMHPNLTHQDKFFKAFLNYTSCLDYVLYFYKDGRRSLPHLPATLSSLCSGIQYSKISIYWVYSAYKERRNTHISDFIIQWLVVPDCWKCQHDGGQCQRNPVQALESVNLKKVPRVGLKIGIGIGTGVGGILLTCIGFILYQRHKRDFSSSSNLISRRISDGSLKPNFENGSIYFQTPIFTYKELDEATNHFDSKKELGDGGYGTVYHGKLRDGRVVAVKRLFEHNYKRVEQFMNEIAILSGLRHQNLVSLYGCTSHHSRELLLVYEYVPNGTVADHLHGDRAGSGLLTWPIRMSIAIESADAVAYLHASDIIHRDIKTNNILLDNGFHVKVADFGLSRLFPTDATHVSTAPQGTPGYVDPEYYQCYQLNDKSDVYSFGVVLIELISSQLAVDIGRHRNEINLANLAVNRIHSQALHELVDPSLGFDSDYDVRIMITLVAELAFRCLQQDWETRPSMVEVVDILKGIESEEYKKKKKNDVPVSPDSVTDIWISTSSTPNTSA